MEQDVEYMALKLVAKFITETLGYPTLNNKQAKQCAIICCEEMLDVYKRLSEDDDIMFPKEIEFINNVIKEIKSL